MLFLCCCETCFTRHPLCFFPCFSDWCSSIIIIDALALTLRPSPSRTRNVPDHQVSSICFFNLSFRNGLTHHIFVRVWQGCELMQSSHKHNVGIVCTLWKFHTHSHSSVGWCIIISIIILFILIEIKRASFILLASTSSSSTTSFSLRTRLPVGCR